MYLGPGFGGDRPDNWGSPDGRFDLRVRLRLRGWLRAGLGLRSRIGLSLRRLHGPCQAGEPRVGLLGPGLHLGGPNLHLINPGLGLLELLEPFAQIQLLAHQEADGSSGQQPDEPADQGAEGCADHG